jgi:hypothetical protein
LNTKPLNENFLKLKDIINIETDFQEKYNNQSVLVSYKNNTFKIIKQNENDTYQYVYTTKLPDIYPQDFLNYHLFELLVKNINYLTKGKCKSINVEQIMELNITIPDIKLQKNAIEYINLGGSILIMLQQQIIELDNMKYNLIESIVSGKKTKPLINFCNIGHISHGQNTIQINKNSNLAGQVSLSTSELENSNNMFFLTVNNDINSEMLYYLLKHNESELIKISNSGNTIQLPKGKLENFQIPILSEVDINKLLKCKDIDVKIKKLNQTYNELLSESTLGIF